MRVTRLKINRFRHVQPNTELEFGSTFNILLGRNAAGKTTLLEVIAAITNDDLSIFRNDPDGFDLEYELVDDVEAKGAIQVAVRRDRAKVQVSSKTSKREPQFEAPLHAGSADRFEEAATVHYVRDGSIAWQCTVADRTVRIVGGPDLKLTDDPSESSFRLGLFVSIAQEDEVLRSTPNALMSLLVASFGKRAGRFDEADESLRRIFGFRLAPPKVPFTEGWPREILTIAAKANLEGDVLQISSQESKTLAEIATVLNFGSVSLQAPVLARSEGELTIGSPRFTLKQDAHTSIGHELLSFGQRRLLAFIWYLGIRQTMPVTADELVNGFHHEWIELCVDRLRATQSFLATQNPLLLDQLPVSGETEAASVFIRCEVRSVEHSQVMSWRRFTEAEARRLRAAREVGIQSVSEVLRFEGLW